MDGADVVLGLSFCGHISCERRRSITPTVLGAAGLVQVPHDEIAVPRARQYLVVVICRRSQPSERAAVQKKKHQLPVHHATSVLALSILSPLPSQRFLERSTRCPPWPTADFWSVVEVSSGPDKRRTRRAARHHRQERPNGKWAVGRTFPPRDHTPHPVFALGHCAAPAGGRTREANVPSRSLVPMKARIREKITWQGLQCGRCCGERRGASLRRRLHTTLLRSVKLQVAVRLRLPVLECIHSDWLHM